MAELIARPACDGLLPIEAGRARLTDVEPGVMTSLSPYRGREDALSEALQAAHGMALPKPGRTGGRAGARCLWFGHAHWLLMGPAPHEGLAEHATLTDQSDAWAVVLLEGAASRDVLARLTPLDLRAAVFRRGHTARAPLGHMQGAVTRLGEESWQLMAFRSMAGTLVHELRTAMEQVAARG